MTVRGLLAHFGCNTVAHNHFSALCENLPHCIIFFIHFYPQLPHVWGIIVILLFCTCTVHVWGHYIACTHIQNLHCMLCNINVWGRCVDGSIWTYTAWSRVASCFVSATTRNGVANCFYTMKTQDWAETSVLLDNDICPTILASGVSLSIISLAMFGCFLHHAALSRSRIGIQLRTIRVSFACSQLQSRYMLTHPSMHGVQGEVGEVQLLQHGNVCTLATHRSTLA